MSEDSGIIRYAKEFTSELEKSIERNNGALKQTIPYPAINSRAAGGDLYANEDQIFQDALEGKKLPVFNSFSNKQVNGMFFMVNDVWGLAVDVADYIFCSKCKNYKAKLRISLHDNFGLDKADVEKYGAPKGFIPEGHWGVYGWYVLQHYKGFGYSKYSPFITKAKAEYDIGINGKF